MLEDSMPLKAWEELSYVSDETIGKESLTYMLLDHFCRLIFFHFYIHISLHNIYQPWLHDLTLWIWFGKMLSYVTWFSSDLDVPWFHTPQSHTEGSASGWGRQHDLDLESIFRTLLEVAHLMLNRCLGLP